MADFDIAYRLTMKHEGGYANNKADRGGETYRGIARKFWSGWIGWPLVDDAKKQPGFPKSLDENLLLQAHVKAFIATASGLLLCPILATRNLPTGFLTRASTWVSLKR